MATDLAAFHTIVRDIINRGTKYDTEIVAETREAAKWLEKNYSFQYMDRFEELSVSDGEVRVIFPPRVKAVKWFRLIVGTNLDKYHYLIGGDPKDFNKNTAKRPDAYWFQQGKVEVVLDSKPDADYSAELMFEQFTDWPTVTTEAPILVVDHESLLKAQVLVNMAPIVRRASLAQEYGALLAHIIRTEILGDEKLEQDESHAMKMYVG